MNDQQKWAMLHKDPATLALLDEPNREMQAYALRRRGYLIFDLAKWDIDTEHVCPGSTAWRDKYHAFYKPTNRVTSPFPFTLQMMTLVQSTADWESVRRVAFMPPTEISRPTRRRIKRLPFADASVLLNSLSDEHWNGTVAHPEIDYPPR